MTRLRERVCGYSAVRSFDFPSLEKLVSHADLDGDGSPDILATVWLRQGKPLSPVLAYLQMLSRVYRLDLGFRL
jgi:hypothetical protein